MEGQVVIDRKTKNLVKRLNHHDIAWIHHQDLDLIAAQELFKKGVKAVINSQPFFTGYYPAKGARFLLQHRIPLYQVPSAAFSLVQEGDWLRIEQDGKIVVGEGKVQITCHRLQAAQLEAEYHEALSRSSQPLQSFVENTLAYAMREKEILGQQFSYPPLHVKLKGRDVLIVARGEYYEEDLRILHSYIQAFRPVLIAVDGGADALIHQGYPPHFIIGDMDSVSEEALRTGAQLLVHAYCDGRAPGMERLKALGCSGQVLCLPGTSEDVAMLLAYDHQARRIVTLGTHTHMVDFLDKGRAGMASTMLIRLKLGEKLLDLKGISQIFPVLKEQREIRWGMVGMLVSTLSLLFLPHFRQLLGLLLIQLKLWLT